MRLQSWIRRGSTRISPTALYTGQTWQAHGLGHPALSPELGALPGRVAYAASEAVFTPVRWAGGPTLTAFLLARHRIIDALLERAIEAGEVGAEQDTVLVDVRNKTEFSHGTVADARQLNAGKVLFHPEQLPAKENGPLITFCQSGLRNSVAAAALRRAGYEVIELEGSYTGWAQWAAAEPSTASGQAPREAA